MQRRTFLAGAALASVTPARPVLTSIRRSRLDPRRLQAVLDEAANSLGVVGAQLAVFDGSVVHELATGFRDRERGLAVTTDTLFQIGSTTKVFNASLIMALVDEGKLDLDRPVISWLPEFRLADREATERITLRHLLSMSAGLDNGPYTDFGRGDDALGRYVASLADIPHIFAPGTGFGYANAGSNVAGFVAERATGRKWEALLVEKILKPAGLVQAGTFAEDLLYHPVALGYRRGESGSPPTRLTTWSLPRSMAPAGGTLCTSAGDLVRLARVFLANGRGSSGKAVLSETAVATMHTPVVELPARLTAQKWCAGPYWKQWGGETIYGHSGTNVSGSSMLLWVPRKNVAIATIANVANQGYPLADRIFNTVFPELFGIAKPKLPTPDTVVPATIDPVRFVGRFEAFGSRIEFAEEGGGLVARSFSGSARTAGPPSMTTELIPLGGDRFLPRDPAMGGNRGWDVAFWGRGAGGQATHFLNGVFAMKRADLG